MLGGIEKTENGSLIAIVYYKDFRTVIPITEMMINRRTVGKKDEVSFVVTHIDEERNVAVGLISQIIRQNLWFWYAGFLAKTHTLLPANPSRDILMPIINKKKKTDAFRSCPLV